MGIAIEGLEAIDHHSAVLALLCRVEMYLAMGALEPARRDLQNADARARALAQPQQLAMVAEQTTLLRLHEGCASEALAAADEGLHYAWEGRVGASLYLARAAALLALGSTEGGVVVPEDRRGALPDRRGRRSGARRRADSAACWPPGAAFCAGTSPVALAKALSAAIVPPT